ncbi:DASH complex subunit DAD1 [Histoplasma ohiense]|nr:DASH complex subunit DAD1 [Histoplasma ohiense (nom. inval.)]
MTSSGMGQPPRPQSAANVSTHFEQQREGLVREIALSLEQVLQNINRLNRNLESVITVGNEFSSVEALWSQFETVMGAGNDGNENEQEHEHEHEHEHEQEREQEGADVET